MSRAFSKDLQFISRDKVCSATHQFSQPQRHSGFVLVLQGPYQPSGNTFFIIIEAYVMNQLYSLCYKFKLCGNLERTRSH